MFIGQDMCTDDGRYYTDDSFYADAGNHYASTDKGQRLPETHRKRYWLNLAYLYISRLLNNLSPKSMNPSNTEILPEQVPALKELLLRRSN